MTLKDRVARDIHRLSLGTVDSKKVAELLERYYSDGLTDGQNDITNQEKQIWEWTKEGVRLADADDARSLKDYANSVDRRFDH